VAVMSQRRPEPPLDGQRSVWDFPRPPAYEQWREHVEIVFADSVIAASDEAWCVLETSHPPTYYLPRSSFAVGTLRPAVGTSVCEWKGVASYLDVLVGDRVAPRAAWTYPEPQGDAAVLLDHVAVYPAAMDRCTVDGEVVRPQSGGFYGGWVTSRVSGPFKGEPGSAGW
jgi:uncharacterized protein (DUF427 family)